VQQTARVQQIPVEQIDPNPHNPRRLFDEEPLQILKESVEKLGILVPVTLYEADGPSAKSDYQRYILLDGERRWRCAKDLGLPNVPAIVVERPDDTQNILTMFHIHNVREGWQLMPTALKLKVLMDRLKEKNERKLTELTKLSLAQIRRCKILLSYPKHFQEMMLAPPTQRMKADFFIELDRIRRPALDDSFEPWVKHGDSKSIELVRQKYEGEVIPAVTDFRRLAEVYKAANEHGRQKRLATEFNKFLDREEMTIDDINVPGASFAQEAKEIQRSAKRLIAQLESIEIEAIASSKDLVKTLDQLQKLLHKRLEAGLLIGVRDAANDEN
jgi:ParB family transcriptional regulator, chromosome partitioning protein